MEIKFKKDIQYHVDFERYMSERFIIFKIRKIFLIWLPFTILIFQYLWNTIPLPRLLIEVGIGLIFVLINYKVYPLLSNKIAYVFFKDIYEIDSIITMVLNENEIIMKNISAEIKVSWNNIDNLIIKDKYIYIHHNGGYIQIPLVAFKSKKENNDFLDYINKKISD